MIVGIGGASLVLTWFNSAALVLLAVLLTVRMRRGQAAEASAVMTAVVAVVLAVSVWFGAIGIGFLVLAALGGESGDTLSVFAAFQPERSDSSSQAAVGAFILIVSALSAGFQMLLRRRLSERGMIDAGVEGMVEAIVLLATSLLFLSHLVALANAAGIEFAGSDSVLDEFGERQAGSDFPFDRSTLAFAIAYGLLWAGYLWSALRRHGISLTTARTAGEREASDE